MFGGRTMTILEPQPEPQPQTKQDGIPSNFELRNSSLRLFGKAGRAAATSDDGRSRVGSASYGCGTRTRTYRAPEDPFRTATPRDHSDQHREADWTGLDKKDGFRLTIFRDWRSSMPKTISSFLFARSLFDHGSTRITSMCRQ